MVEVILRGESDSAGRTPFATLMGGVGGRGGGVSERCSFPPDAFPNAALPLRYPYEVVRGGYVRTRCVPAYGRSHSSTFCTMQ